jgi:uncharacterized protein (TIGR03084 family)
MDDTVVDALDAEQRDLVALVSDLDSSGLRTASRCDGWTVADVLVHLAQTNELAAASARGRLAEEVAAGPEVAGADDVDEWAAAAVDAERPDDPRIARSRYVASAADQLDAFRAVEPSERVMWVAGEMAARTLASTRLAETWIHARDIAAGLGIEPAPTERLWHVARLAHRTLPYAFARAGEEMHDDVAFVLAAPDGREWVFGDPGSATTVHGAALELCEVAGQRRPAAGSGLRARGPDADRTLALVRTFA